MAIPKDEIQKIARELVQNEPIRRAEEAARREQIAQQSAKREAIIKATIAAMPDDRSLAWIEIPGDISPGRLWAIDCMGISFASVSPNGDWFMYHSGPGSSGSIIAAKAQIELFWANQFNGWASFHDTKTEKQIIAAYRQRLVNAIKSAGVEQHDKAIAAIKALHQCGWLDKCPPLDEAWVGYMHAPMRVSLLRLGKITVDEGNFG